MQHRASPRGGATPPARRHCRLACRFPGACTHTHTQRAGNLLSERKLAKQSHKLQSCPSPFHPTLERTFAHGFTSEGATLSWSQLLHDLDGAARPAVANSHAPQLQKSLSSKSHLHAP